MPGDRVEVIRQAFEAFERGDEPAMLALMDPDIVAMQFPEQPDVRPYHGHDGLRQVMRDWIGAWEDWSLTVKEMREIGEHVVVALDQRARGRTSGVAVQIDTWFVFTVPAGLVTRWRMFTSEQQALEAAGASV
jgi:ketosteroid isomerase-like protein